LATDVSLGFERPLLTDGAASEWPLGVHDVVARDAVANTGGVNIHN